jgi:hypothetical protein
MSAGGAGHDDYEVVALLTASAAASLAVATSSLTGAVQDAGARLEAVVGAPEPGVPGRYYRAIVGDQHTAAELVRRMREIDGVEAAYVKPGGEPPR